MASETMRRLDEIVGSFREGVIVRVSCGGMLCGECIQCTARAAKASLQREQRAAQDEIAHLTRELEAEREQVRALRAYVAAEIEHTVHRVTCETCIVGGECDEEQDLWEKMDQARNLAWELVRPGVTKLRVDAITGALIEAPTSTERER